MNEQLEKQFIELILSPINGDDIISSLNRLEEIRSHVRKIWHDGYRQGADEMKEYTEKLTKCN